ncbi:MAG: hypothetical protein WCZ66_11255 [Sphingomonadaceae bacterium]
MKNGLLLVLTEVEGERYDAAIETAATAAALGRPVALLLRGPAVLQPDKLSMLKELGANISACQTALSRYNLDAGQHLPRDIPASGLMQFMAGRERWQLLLA